ncbi:hypothetical protein [Paucibacter sp. KBW04]|uniref:hypothetical protein n=1 Tax=Paucibacter sp. KBW04 TaxID=2153361 RepID=UPI000F567BE4|nr:hypothetical protein [Paucibacter sp. KBW04]
MSPQTEFELAPCLESASSAAPPLVHVDELAPPQSFNASTGTLLFTVHYEQRQITAYLSHSTWMARFGLGNSDSSLLELYLLNRRMIDAAVVRCLEAGSRNPVVLRPDDL